MTDEARDVGDARQEFLDSRSDMLGATDGPKILGLARYGTPLTVYREKTGDAPPDEPSLPAWLGLKLQGTVAELYTAAMDIRVRADNRKHFSRDYAFIGCHLDFRAWGRPRLLIECKTKAYMKGWGEDGSSDVPAEVWVQVQHEMYVVGAEEAHVAVLFGHHTFRVYVIARDEAFLEKYVPRLVDFWHMNVLAGVPPEPIGHYLDDKAIRAEHPGTYRAKGEELSLKSATPEQEAIVRKLQSVRLNAAQVAVAQEEVENKVKQIIGDHDGLQGSFGRITFKRSKDSQQVDWEHVAATYGNVIDDLFLIANPGDDEQLVARLARAQAVYDTAVGLATVTKPGSRRFLVDFKE